MIKTYTYQDWKKSKIIDLPENIGIRNEYFRALSNAGILGIEDLLLIQEKQKWTYDKAFEININAKVYNLKSELCRTKFPERYLQRTKEKIKEDLEPVSFHVENVLNGIEDYQNMRGSSYEEVQRVLKKEKAPGFEIFALTFLNRKWVPNENLLVASLLGFEKILIGKSVKEILAMGNEKPSKKNISRKGRKIDDRLNLEKTREYFEEFKYSKTVKSLKFHDDGTVNQYQLIKFILDKNTGVSESTVERRVKKILK